MVPWLDCDWCSLAQAAAHCLLPPLLLPWCFGAPTRAHGPAHYSAWPAARTAGSEIQRPTERCDSTGCPPTDSRTATVRPSAVRLAQAMGRLVVHCYVLLRCQAIEFPDGLLECCGWVEGWGAWRGPRNGRAVRRHDGAVHT